MRDKCNEHIKYEFDLLSISILISDIEIITNIDLNKGYCLKKNTTDSKHTEIKITK